MKPLINVLLAVLAMSASTVLCAAESFNVAVGDNLFLQACGNDPKTLFPEGKVVPGLVQEVPNVVLTKEASPYGKPFTTKAVSIVPIGNGQVLVATLTNLRDLNIMDSTGKSVYSRKATATTSIYELKLYGQTIGWGLGWHNECKKKKENSGTEFTTLRVILPFKTAEGLKVEDKLFSGAYLASYSMALARAIEPVIALSGNITSHGITACNYCLPRFMLLSATAGFVEIKTPRELAALGVEGAAPDHMIHLAWMAQYGLVDEVAGYLATNYDLVYQDAAAHMKRSSVAAWDAGRQSSQKTACLQEVKTPRSLAAVGAACFPELAERGYFGDVSAHHE